MSGRIEMYDNQKEPTSKWSRNESFAVKDAGVDIGADPEGGSGGTTDYVDLSNKPQINSIELNGNKSLDDLYIQEKLTPGAGISIAYNEQHKLAISQDITTFDTIQLTQIPGVLGWSDVSEAIVRNGFAQITIRCGTGDYGITEEHKKLYYGFPEPIGSAQLYGICEGKIYRFYIDKAEDGEIYLYCRSKINEVWKEISIFGVYLCK